MYPCVSVPRPSGRVQCWCEAAKWRRWGDVSATIYTSGIATPSLAFSQISLSTHTPLHSPPTPPPTSTTTIPLGSVLSLLSPIIAAATAFIASRYVDWACLFYRLERPKQSMVNWTSLCNHPAYSLPHDKPKPTSLPCWFKNLTKNYILVLVLE